MCVGCVEKANDIGHVEECRDEAQPALCKDAGVWAIDRAESRADTSDTRAEGAASPDDLALLGAEE